MVETPAQQQVSRELSPVRWCDKEVDGVYLGRSGWVQVQHKSMEESLRPPPDVSPVKIKMADYHCSRSEPGQLGPPHLHIRQRRPGYLPLPPRRGFGTSLDLSPCSLLDITGRDPSLTPPPVTPIISPPPAFQDNHRRFLEVLSSPLRAPRAAPPLLSRSDAIEDHSPPHSPPVYRRLLSPLDARPQKRTPSPLASPRTARSLEVDTARRTVLYRQKYDSSSSSSGSFGFRSLDAGGGSRGGGGLPRLTETDSSLGGYEDGDEEDNNNNEETSDVTIRNSSPEGGVSPSCRPPGSRLHPRPPPPRRSPNSHHLHHHHHHQHNNIDTELSPARSPCSSSSSSSSCSGHRSPSAAQLRHHRRHNGHHHHHQPQSWNNNGNTRVRRSRSLQLPERRSPAAEYHHPQVNHTGTVDRHRKRFPLHSRSVQSEETTLEAEMRREAEEEARVVTEFLYGGARSREAARALLRARGPDGPQLNPCNPTTCDFWPHCAHRDGLYTTTRVTTPNNPPGGRPRLPAQPNAMRASHSCPDRAGHAGPKPAPRGPSSRSSPASLERMNERQREVSPTSRPRPNGRRPPYYNGNSLDSAEDPRRKTRTRRNVPPPLENLGATRGTLLGAVESPPPPLLLSPSPLNAIRQREAPSSPLVAVSTSEEDEDFPRRFRHQRHPERPGSAPAAAEPRPGHSPHSPPDSHHHQRSLSLPKCFQPPPPPSSSSSANCPPWIVGSVSQQSAPVGSARQPYMSATLDGYQYRRQRKQQQQYIPQQQQQSKQQPQQILWSSTTSPTASSYPSGLLAPTKLQGRHTQSLARTAPPTPVRDIGAAGGLCCPNQEAIDGFDYDYGEDGDEDNDDRYSSAPLLLDPLEFEDNHTLNIHGQNLLTAHHNDEWRQQPLQSTARREWSQCNEENYEDYGHSEKKMEEDNVAAARTEESGGNAVRPSRNEKHASLPHSSRNTLLGHSGETSVLQKFKKSFSLRFYKKGSSGGGGGSGVASQDEEDNLTLLPHPHHPQLRGSDLEATSQESIDQDPTQQQQFTSKKSNTSVDRKDDTAVPANSGSNTEKFRFGPLVWRSSKERKKAKKATRNAKCNSGDSGIQVEVIGGGGSIGNRAVSGEGYGCDSSESHDTDDVGATPQAAQSKMLHPSTAGASVNDGNDTPLEDEPDSPAIVRRRTTGRGQDTSHYYQRPSRPTSDVINQILIDKLKADLQASRGTSRNGGPTVRRTHSDLGGQRLYNWEAARGCYGRRTGTIAPGSPGKSRVPSTPAPAPASPRPPRMTEAQIRHLKRLRWRPSHLRRSISQPIGINELSPLMQRKPAGRNIVHVLSEDERGGGRGGVATSSDDEIALSDSGSSVSSLTGRKKSFEQAMNEQVVILAEAVWDHVAMETEELAFRAGDVIEVLDTLDKDWWWGATSQQTGWFPSAFVRLRVSQEETVEDCLEECLSGRRTDDRASSVGSSVRRRGNSGGVGSLLSNDQVRTRVVTELVNTERDFVKILNDVQQGFMAECRKRTDMFNEDQVRSIFSNLEELLEFQVMFLSDLEATIDWDTPHRTCLADIFLKHHSGFRMYSEYCNSHPMAIATLQELYQRNSYRKFFEACRLMRGLIEIPLDGYLLTPVQRICKYPLQLAELLKYTKTDHPDFYKLSEALNAMRGVAVLINERKRRMESLEKLAAWQQRVEGWEGEDLIETSSQLIHQGEAVRITTGLWTTNITLFLFDHQLVYCKKDILKKSTYVYKGRIQTDTSQVVNLNDGKDSTLGATIRHGIKVYCCESDKWLLFCLRSSQEKQQWLEAFARERDLVEQDARDGLELGPSARQLLLLATTSRAARPGTAKHRTQATASSSRNRQRRRRPPRPNQEPQSSKKRERANWRSEDSTAGRRGTPPPPGSPGSHHLQPQAQQQHNTSLGKKVGTWFTFGANRKTRRALGARASTIDSTVVHPS